MINVDVTTIKRIVNVEVASKGAKGDIGPAGVNYFLGLYISLAALELAHPTAVSGNYATVDTGAGTNAINYIWDEEEGWVAGGSAGSGSSPQALRHKTVTFTTAEILDETLKNIVPHVGLTKQIFAVSLSTYIEFNSIAYNNSALAILNENNELICDSLGILNAIVESGTYTKLLAPDTASTSKPLSEVNLQFTGATDGDSDVTITLSYMVFDTATGEIEELGGVTPSGTALDHAIQTNKDIPNQHPISAITLLTEELANKVDKIIGDTTKLYTVNPSGALVDTGRTIDELDNWLLA